MDPESFSHHG